MVVLLRSLLRTQIPHCLSSKLGSRFALRTAACNDVSRVRRYSQSSMASQLSQSQEPKERNLIRDQIIQKIEVTGPITIAEYMKIVLTSPISGFYMKQDVFGSKGHFTTSPEISQVFGELIGIWIINEWQRFNCNKPFRIIELGPGRGTLAYDISRVLSQFSHTRDSVSLHMVEVSPYLMQVQEQTLCGHICVHEKDFKGTHDSLTTTGIPVTWYSSLDEVPEEPGFSVYVAHEFLDALPIHKFQKNSEGQWREVLVAFEDNKELKYVLSRNPTPACKFFIPPEETGDHYEACPEALLTTEKIARRINANDGCFLICDYGYDCSSSGRSKDTFRAFREHTLWDPLKEPGTADLTADVDFAQLKERLYDKALVFGPVTQAYFLKCLGIDVRLQKLLQTASEKEARDLRSGVDMIMQDMGQRFKFLSLFPKNATERFKHNPPAGFA